MDSVRAKVDSEVHDIEKHESSVLGVRGWEKYSKQCLYVEEISAKLSRNVSLVQTVGEWVTFEQRGHDNH